MATVKVIDPISRLEGHLKIEVTIDTVSGVQQVVDARATGTMFRGFENILKNRPPQDAPHITERVCGVCPVSHGLAACLAADKGANITVTTNARVMRNLVLAANFVQSHILHFYHLAAMDYVNGPNQAPWQPSWQTDKRITGTAAANLVNNYLVALDMRRKAHEMGAIFGGKLPHPASFVPGGITAQPTASNISKFRTYLNTLIPFIQNTYISDVTTLGTVYSDYFRIGKGHGNLLAYGVFDLDAAGNTKLLRRGRLTAGNMNIQTVDVNSITEKVGYSWYAKATNNLNPANGVTTPEYPKSGAYTWLKAPRYLGLPYETGPLARMIVNGDYSKTTISAMDRHVARAYEALKIAQAALTWLNGLSTTGAYYTPYTAPASATTVGLTEAARGALGHWVKVTNGVISNYQIITPTCWNASPRDGAGNLGPIEKALVGTPIRNVNEPIEVARVIHSFDPCLSCAVHIMRPKNKETVFTLSAGGCAS